MHKIDYEEFFKSKDKKEFENEYLGIFIDKRCKKKLKFLKTYEQYNKKYKSFKSNNKLEKLPVELKDLFIASYKDLVDLFVDYNEALKSDDKKKSLVDIVFCDKIKNTKKSTKKVRTDVYEKFSEEIRSFFSKYANDLNLYSCAYCECAYTGSWNDGEYNSDNNKGFFALDHFFPKSIYPLFSLCLYNFVPCCNACNTGVKGNNFFDIDFSDANKAKEKLMHLSPVSTEYNFENNVTIRYIPKLKEKKTSDKKTEFKTETWHYEPLALSESESYQVFFDMDFSENKNTNKAEIDAAKEIVDSMKLNERYNSLAIKNKGLYLLDLKKRYPASNIKMLSDLLSVSSYPASLDEIEKGIFHKDEKFILNEKMKNDLLE